MKDRDFELDEMLQPLMELKPSAEQMRRWSSFQKRPSRKVSRLNRAFQLAAACLVGFFIGFYFKGKESSHSETALNLDNSATIEVVYTKNE
jgi:hypothetical protein